MVGTDPSWWKRDTAAGIINVVNPAQRFYADLAPDLVSAAVDHLRPQSARSFEGRIRGPGLVRDAMTYMVCDADQAIPPAAQQAMGQELRDGGAPQHRARTDARRSDGRSRRAPRPPVGLNTDSPTFQRAVNRMAG